MKKKVTLQDPFRLKSANMAGESSDKEQRSSTTTPLPEKNPYSFVEQSIIIDNNLSAPGLLSAKEPLRGPAEHRIPAHIGPDPRNSTCTVTFDPIPVQVGGAGVRFDFAYGYRLLLPPGVSKKYKVKVFDLDSGLQLEEHDHRGGNWVVGERKYFIRYRIEIYRDGKLIFEHDYDCTGQRVYIIIPDGGLGDNLAWLPYADLFQRHHRADVNVVIGEWMIKLVGDLYPGLTFIPAGNPKLDDSYANYFCGIFNQDKTAWRPVAHQHLGMQAAIAAILNLPREPLKCRLPIGSKRPFREPYVCISSMATNPGKYWNFPDGWNTLIRFLKSHGYRVLDIDRDPQLFFAGKKYTIPSEAEDFTGLVPLKNRIDLLEHADFFVGLPSGLSWLAWNVDIPVVMLSGFTMPNCEFPTPYRVTNYNYCHGCWNDSNCFFDQHVPVWCPRHAGTSREIECTKAITPQMVERVIRQIPVFQQQAALVKKW